MKVIGKYIVVEAPYPGEPERMASPEGLFTNLQQVKSYIRNDADATFVVDEDQRGRIENWGSPQYICQIIKVFKPIPVVGVKIRLDEMIRVPKKKETP